MANFTSVSAMFSALQKGWLKNVLEGAGLTLGTGAITLLALNTALQTMQNNFNSLGATILQLAGLSGFDIGFSLITGAIVTKYVQQSTNLTLKKL